MALTVCPFIPEHAAEFAQQLLGFLASKLTVAGHDRAVFGELPAGVTQQAVASTEPGMQRLLHHVTLKAWPAAAT